MAKFYFEFPSAGLNLAPERCVSLAKAGVYQAGILPDGSFVPEANIVSYYDKAAAGYRVARMSNYWLAMPLIPASEVVGDVEIHAVITRDPSGGGNFTNTGGGLYIACDDTGENYYAITSGGQGSVAQRLTVMERKSGVNTFPYSVIQSDSDVGNMVGAKRHFRVRVSDGTIYVKRWADTVPEPTNWAITFANTLGAGSIGLFLNGEDVIDTVHFFSVGTDGDSAPSLADAPSQVFWGVVSGLQVGERLRLADSFTLQPLADIAPSGDGAWVQALPGYVPPAHLQRLSLSGDISIMPDGVSGDGFLGGTYPVGGVTDDGVPVGSAEIEVVLRNPGGMGNGAIVATTTTDASGSWRVAGLSMNHTFDVIARTADRNDAIVSRVVPEHLVDVTVAGGLSLIGGGTALSGALKAIGGTAPYSIGRLSGRLPYGMEIEIAEGESVALPDAPGVREAGDFTATFEISDSLGKTAQTAVSISGARRAQAFSVVADDWSGGINATQLSLQVPASVQEGDLLVIGLIHRESARELATPVSNEPGALLEFEGGANAYRTMTGYHWQDIYTLRATAETAGSVISVSGPSSTYKFLHITGLRSNDGPLLEVKRHEIDDYVPTTPPERFAIPEIDTKGGLVLVHTANPFAFTGASSVSQWTNAVGLNPVRGTSSATLRGGVAYYWQGDNLDQLAEYYCGGALSTPAIAISRLYIDEIRPDLPGW